MFEKESYWFITLGLRRQWNSKAATKGGGSKMSQLFQMHALSMLKLRQNSSRWKGDNRFPVDKIARSKARKIAIHYVNTRFLYKILDLVYEGLDSNRMKKNPETLEQIPPDGFCQARGADAKISSVCQRMSRNMSHLH